MNSFLNQGFPSDPGKKKWKEPAREKVARVLRDRPGVYLTSHDLATMTGLGIGQVNGAIYSLTRRGNILRRLLNGRAGRYSMQAYSWVVVREVE